MSATFTVDPWDPGYGMALGNDAMTASTAKVNLDVETASNSWAPIDAVPSSALPATLLFCDGVRRIDARVWVHSPDSPQPSPAIAASYAAGLVECNIQARVIDAVISRGLFTAAPDAADIEARIARYPVRPATGTTPDELSLAIQQRLSDAEVQLALAYRSANLGIDDLLVIDGQLRGREQLPRSVGYIKTHQAAYLPAEQASVVSALTTGQRTPVFTIGTSWIRRSWYLRLPGPSTAPWAGVVRLEYSADAPAHEAIHIANVTALLLPRFASTPHKDPRAPQNLVPIGGLEQQLRHRLGDQQLLYRALRRAATL